jgi:hypothetical protein
MAKVSRHKKATEELLTLVDELFERVEALEAASKPAAPKPQPKK